MIIPLKLKVIQKEPSKKEVDHGVGGDEDGEGQKEDLYVEDGMVDV